MTQIEGASYYPPLEEKINIVSHSIGLLFSVAAFVLLVSHASLHGNFLHIVSFGIFGASLIVLYAASTVYHSTREPGLRTRLRVLDHASIYVLIAGTYTPFALVTLNGSIGWALFGIAWTLAVAGITLKLFFTGKYKLFSTLMYVLMGWLMVFVIKPLINSIAMDGLLWLFAGGMAYTVGAILYSIKAIKFNHAIFHLFVLLGSACHFVSVFVYVLPWQ